MTWTQTESVHEFRAAAGDFLAAHPAENTVLLTLANRPARAGAAGGDPEQSLRSGWWRPDADGPVAGAWMQAPLEPLRLSRMPVAAAEELVDELVGDPWLTGVGGGVAQARAFGDRWAARTGGAVEVEFEQRLYRLGELLPPQVPGRLRPVTERDFEQALAWVLAFFAEVDHQAERVPEYVRVRAAAGELFLWEDASGRPVAMAGLSGVLAGMARIGQVYTPPEQRGHGYASAVTAAVSQVGRDRGAEQVLLYTDLANPTANSIYQKIGYRPVEDTVVLKLRRDPEGAA
ncbi:GNAT family N-acetyltransferase [Kitasatospora viridis]|uniref:FR47-like protein n=1 Tax=Kitasatospora viridis TaxID=281105 RepID=A0A561UFQ0_9ACTN|nr:GNAT family N-acetyltransferase [Kitasatospora viridis]TWF98175.1 FR47-like protein [Kitasatospora viridis]